jgi:riboflavin kinase/FMN adenylyltransferase
MEYFIDYKQLLDKPTPCVLSIGSFDGWHCGHRILLDRCAKIARAKGIETAVLTFEPHPARALAPGLSPPLLMSYARKIKALDHLPCDLVLVQKFTKDFAELSAEEFVHKVLVDALSVDAVVVGDDFTFGCHRSGQVEDLLAMGRKFGFEVDVVRRLAVEGMIASSTRIRSFVLQGRVKAAAILLGRSYTIAGRVVVGAGRGRKLGFPTANLLSDAELLPARGVYVTQVWRQGHLKGNLSVTNIGVNPTFGSRQQSMETHILDLDENLKGCHLALAFLKRIRPEVSFPSPEELIAQIGRDISTAREWAKKHTRSEFLDPLCGIELDTEPHP